MHSVLSSFSEERAGCFTQIGFLMSFGYKGFVALPQGAVDWPAV